MTDGFLQELIFHVLLSQIQKSLSELLRYGEVHDDDCMGSIKNEFII